MIFIANFGLILLALGHLIILSIKEPLVNLGPGQTSFLLRLLAYLCIPFTAEPIVQLLQILKLILILSPSISFGFPSSLSWILSQVLVKSSFAFAFARYIRLLLSLMPLAGAGFSRTDTLIVRFVIRM